MKAELASKIHGRGTARTERQEQSPGVIEEHGTSRILPVVEHGQSRGRRRGQARDGAGKAGTPG